MNVRQLVPLAALLLVVACGDTRRVEQPLTDVSSMLMSLPGEADALKLATPFPGTAYYLEPQGDRLIWHFTKEGKDYGRFIAALKEDGSSATKVSTWFESADDAKGSANLGFLRKIARIAGEESVHAALDHRAIDRQELRQRLISEAGKDPLGAATATMQSVGDEMDRLAAEQDARVRDNEPVYPRPGVLPRKGGRGGPRDD
jgi:hypothetical protein